MAGGKREARRKAKASLDSSPGWFLGIPWRGPCRMTGPRCAPARSYANHIATRSKKDRPTRAAAWRGAAHEPSVGGAGPDAWTRLLAVAGTPPYDVPTAVTEETMKKRKRWIETLAALAIPLFLASCGGGVGDCVTTYTDGSLPRRLSNYTQSECATSCEQSEGLSVVASCFWDGSVQTITGL